MKNGYHGSSGVSVMQCLSSKQFRPESMSASISLFRHITAVTTISPELADPSAGVRGTFTPESTSSSQAAAPPARLVSLDAFRGAIMLLMASSGFGVPALAKNFPNSPFWQFL